MLKTYQGILEEIELNKRLIERVTKNGELLLASVSLFVGIRQDLSFFVKLIDIGRCTVVLDNKDKQVRSQVVWRGSKLC